MLTIGNSHEFGQLTNGDLELRPLNHREFLSDAHGMPSSVQTASETRNHFQTVDVYRGLSAARGVILGTAASVVTLLGLLVALPWYFVVAIWAVCTIALLLLMTIAAPRNPREGDLGSETAEAAAMASGGLHVPSSIG